MLAARGSVGWADQWAATATGASARASARMRSKNEIQPRHISSAAPTIWASSSAVKLGSRASLACSAASRAWDSLRISVAA